MNHTANLPVIGDSLSAYLARVNSIPVLTVEEEKTLTHRLHQQGDIEAARSLVMSHLRFVVHIARGYNGYGLPLNDLIQEGNVGLMKAIKRFDPSHEVRLVTFAVHWIRAEIHEFILRNWRIVKIATTKPQRKLFFKLRSMKSHLGWLRKDEAEAIAKDLGVKPETVKEMEGRLSANDMAFDLNPTEDDEGQTYAPTMYLTSDEATPEQALIAETENASSMADLSDALKNLDARSRDILTRRWLNEDKATLHDLANEYGISAERIRQIEKTAMEKMKKAILTV